MRKKRRTRGHHRMTSNVFNMFNQQQIQEFKEAFKMIDQDQVRLNNLHGVCGYSNGLDETRPRS